MAEVEVGLEKPDAQAPGGHEVAVALEADGLAQSLIEDVRLGLGSPPRTLAPKWLYDAEGSRLFDLITRLDEYYPTEAERSILSEHCHHIVAACDANIVIELGSGTSDKTRLLLDAFDQAGRLDRFCPVDVSDETLREASQTLAERYPRASIEALVGDFTQHLDVVSGEGRRLVAFLGSTIGNFYSEERRSFYRTLAGSLAPGDWLLIGTDLVKDADRLVAAYHDSAGLTEQFVRNSLRVLNRELDGDFDLAEFLYVPLWDPVAQRMDLRLRSLRDQRVHLPAAGLVFDLFAGEELCVEISTKFTVHQVISELDEAGFVTEQMWTDADGDFAVTLARLNVDEG